MPFIKNNYQPGKLFKLLRNLKGIKQDAAFNFTQEEIEMAKRFLPLDSLG